jgi:hypothetical protein
VAKQQFDQETQVGPSDSYVDNLPSGSTLQTDAENLRDDLNALRSQVRRIIHGLALTGKWFDDPATVFGGDASLKALFGSLGNAATVRSETGQFTVPFAVSVHNLVYITDSMAADKADNTSKLTIPVAGIVIEKPTNTTATLTFFGVVTGFTGLTPGADLFLGEDGGIIMPPLPTTPGTVIQKVGQALSPTILLLDPDTPIVL